MTRCPLLLLALMACAHAAPATQNQLVIHADQPGPQISRMIYGHFAEHLGRCIYEGIWVGEDSPIPNTRGIRNDVVKALKQIKTPVLRWPGGCFADEYHWKDGIGPREKRPTLINTHWGGVVENNHFGTHEFMDLCAQLNAEPYIATNLGSGSVQEMMDWVEYLTSDANSPMANLRRKNGQDQPWKVKYFGIGNENWGCGGDMTPEFYADNFRRYSCFAKNHSGNKIYRIACGANAADFRWTDVLSRNAGPSMDGLSLHYYTIYRTPDGNASATQFDELTWHRMLLKALEMDDLVMKHAAIMDQADPKKRIGMIVDEWGTWHAVEPGTNPGFLYQQNTLRDALVAGVTLNIFNQHADRVKMANIAQTVNVLQAMILTDKGKMIVTPTYHVFDMYAVHHDATLLPSDLTTPAYEQAGQQLPVLNVSASRDQAGRMHVSLCNLDPTRPAELQGEIRGTAAKQISGRVLTAPKINSLNTFDQPEAVQVQPFLEAKVTAQGFTATLPPKSVVVLELQ